MSNSLLVDYIKLSPNYNKRKYKITKITIHHMAGNLSVEGCGNVFATSARQASSNYGVGTDGRVGLYVDEKNRAWTSSNADNDHRAVTIEVANDGGGPNWHVSDKALQTTIDLCVDICKRNGIERLNFTGDKSGNLTMHKYFTNTACPGPYLASKFPYIAAEVNKRLGVKDPEKVETPKVEVETPKAENKVVYKDKLYRIRKSWGDSKSQIGAYKTLSWAKNVADKNPGYKVYNSSGEAVYPKPKTETPKPETPEVEGYLVKVTAHALNVRNGPGTSHKVVTVITKNNVYTIIDEVNGWGKLKSGAGWIKLSYTKRV